MVAFLQEMIASLHRSLAIMLEEDLYPDYLRGLRRLEFLFSLPGAAGESVEAKNCEVGKQVFVQNLVIPILMRHEVRIIAIGSADGTWYQGRTSPLLPI